MVRSRTTLPGLLFWLYQQHKTGKQHLLRDMAAKEGACSCCSQKAKLFVTQYYRISEIGNSESRRSARDLCDDAVPNKIPAVTADIFLIVVIS